MLTTKTNDPTADPWDGLRFECPWVGTPFLTAPYLALDTETTLVDLSREVPELVLATVTNGSRHVVLRPEQLAPFIEDTLGHGCEAVVMYNAAFDWWVIRRHLELTRAQDALLIWDRLPHLGLVRDAMLLDFLVRLADAADPGVLRMRDLGRACMDRIGVAVPKDCPYRLRFGELLTTPWAEADPGFFLYAVHDTVATWQLWGALLRHPAARTAPDAGPHGILTEGLQTRASLALAHIGRHGVAVDQGMVAVVKGRLQGKIADGVVWLRANGYGDLFSSYKVKARAGELRVHKKTGTPLLKQGPLREHLSRAAVAAGMDPSDIQRTPKGLAVTTALDYWREALPGDPFVGAWTGLCDASKILQFVVQLDGKEAVYTSYRVLTRTGRTSASGPNIQQMPREPWFRELFTARPGHKLIIVDYAAIELRTLAAVLLDRYGESQLAEVIKGGRDPHAFTAAMVLGLSYEDFLALKKSDPAMFKKYRQAAKAVNFGVPGGLGPTKLAAYAKTNYGVAMTVEEATRLRDALTTQVYPELSRYLASTDGESMAVNLRCTPRRLVEEWGRTRGAMFKGRAMDVNSDRPFAGFTGVLGGQNKRNGDPYSVRYSNGVWSTLFLVCKDPALKKLFRARKGSPGLYRRVMGERVVTLTGRVRGGASYTEARNTPFQALAADGAKVALWRLFREGFKVVAFVHDEVVVEVPFTSDGKLAADRARVEKVMIEAMESVLGHGIPVAVEGCVSDRWVK